MKAVKVLMIAIVALFAFEGAKAQVVVKARVGAPVHRHYHRRPVRRTVVVTRPVIVHHRYHRRPAVVRPVYRGPHRRVVTRTVIR
jgi:hypothetical protein